jgi:HD domain
MNAPTRSGAPQPGRRRMILQQPVAKLGHGEPDVEMQLLAALDADTVMMMGDNPALPALPAKPKLLDFFKLRFGPVTRNHLCQSAMLALKAGHPEKVVMACLLHDISNGALIRSDHGYWGAQLVAPYVDEEVSWAIKYHQALRFYPDESVGYGYPEAYVRFFGADYVPPAYIRQSYEEARNHRFYMTSRIITLNDIYSFAEGVSVDPAEFTDIIGRNFREPEEGLGFDASPVAHMWRTMIWPNNFL